MTPSAQKSVVAATFVVAALTASLLTGCSGEPDAVATISGRVQQGPTCPVETSSSPCPPAPAAGVAVELRASSGSSDSGDVIATTTTDADGGYQLRAPSGDFELVARSTDGLPSEVTEQVHLDAGDDLAVDFMLDTGIR